MGTRWRMILACLAGSISSLAVADRDGDGGAIDDLEKRVVLEDVAAFLNGCPFRGGPDLDVWLRVEKSLRVLHRRFLEAAGGRWMVLSRSSSMPPCACGRHV